MYSVILRNDSLAHRTLCVILVFVLLSTPLAAGWLSWIGAACSCAAPYAALFPPEGTVVAFCLVGVQVCTIATDAVWTLFTGGDPFNPTQRPVFSDASGCSESGESAAFLDPPPPFLPEGEGFLNAHFQHLEFQEDESTDALVTSYNTMIDVFNAFLEEARSVDATLDDLQFLTVALSLNSLA